MTTWKPKTISSAIRYTNEEEITNLIIYQAKKNLKIEASINQQYYNYNTLQDKPCDLLTVGVAASTNLAAHVKQNL